MYWIQINTDPGVGVKLKVDVNGKRVINAQHPKNHRKGNFRRMVATENG